MSIPHRATVLVLSPIATVVLAIFDTPVITGQLKQSLRAGLVRPQGSDCENGFGSFFPHLTLADMLGVAVNANHLGDASQTERRRVSGEAPELALFDSPVALIQRAGLRGEVCRAAVARPWPAPLAGWP